MMRPIPAQLHELTSIRAFAALVVVLFHMFFSTDAPSGFFTNLIAHGHLGVDLFFMLSGFILTHVYVQPWRAQHFSYAIFIRNRFARIYPLHLTVLLLLLAAYQAIAFLGLQSEAEGQNWAHFPWHVLLLHAWGFTDGHSWNFPSWSVSAEVFAYLAFPLVLGVMLRTASVWVLLGIALALFAAASVVSLELLNSEITKLMFNFGILRVIVEFILGVALYLLMEKYRLPDRTIRPAVILSLLAVIGLSANRADERLIVLALAALLSSVAHLALQERSNILRHPWLIYLGEISYATYMIHIPTLMVVRTVAGKLGITGDILPPMLMLCLVYVGSVVLFHYVERPGRRLLRTRCQ